MKNLHLMPMNSSFEDNIVTELNKNFDNNKNLFVFKKDREIVGKFDNCIVNPNAFSVKFINEHYAEFNNIVLHSLFLDGDEILALSDEAAKKIIWCVWGHDLYTVPKKKRHSFNTVAKSSIHFCKKLLRGTYISLYLYKRRVSEKIGLFHSIAIGYSYDEKIIRKKYGENVTVCFAPYFSNFRRANFDKIKNDIKKDTSAPFNILIGHCGFDFIEHEKYLKKLAAYKNERIRINMVLSYGAFSKEKIEHIKNLAISIFGSDKCTIVTDVMSREKYFEFLSTMDAAIFPYKHQSGLDNVWALTYFGAKMYFHPDGVLYKGFSASGVKVFDCRKIGKLPYKSFCEYDEKPDDKSTIFSAYDYDENIKRWGILLQ